MVRTTGLLAKLEESWTGPWSIVEKCGPVSYRVKPVNGKSRGRVVHLNTVKSTMREECAQCLTVLSDDDVDGDVIEAIGSQRNLVGEGTCMGFCRKELDEVLER